MGTVVAQPHPSLDGAALAQIFTLPHATNARARVAVEVETLRTDCGARLDLAVATARPGQGLLSKRVVTRPGTCGTTESLVLKNIVKDLNVAAR